MKSKRVIKGTAASKDLVITRVLDAPVELVWKAWTDPEIIGRWWGPKTYTAPFIKADFKVGGKSLFAMRGPDGKDIWSTGTYKEIVPMKRIVTTDSFADKHGKVVPATYYGMGADLPIEMKVTITFSAQGDKTKMTLRHSGLPAGKMSKLTGRGWNESFDKLDASLASAYVIAEPGKNEIIMKRTFDAPRDMVFKIFTDPKLIPQWWGPKGANATVDEMDVRFGGTWRYTHRTPEGSEYSFRGVYHHVQAPECIVETFEYKGLPGHIMLETIVFEEHEGQTRMINTFVFQSVEDRDGVIHSGIERGATETLDRFADLLARLGERGKRGGKK